MKHLKIKFWKDRANVKNASKLCCLCCFDTKTMWSGLRKDKQCLDSNLKKLFSRLKVGPYLSWLLLALKTRHAASSVKVMCNWRAGHTQLYLQTILFVTKVHTLRIRMKYGRLWQKVWWAVQEIRLPELLYQRLVFFVFFLTLTQ